jgi:hypothetical protein
MKENEKEIPANCSEQQSSYERPTNQLADLPVTTRVKETQVGAGGGPGKRL